MYQIGSIILVENQIFDIGYDNVKHQIDHSKKRPAIIIAETEDDFYYLTLTSKQGSGTYCYKTNETILTNGTIKMEKEPKLQYVKLRHIYKKKIYGAIEITRINDQDLLLLLSNLYSYQKNSNDKLFKEIEEHLLKKMKEIALNLENNKNKKSSRI